MKNLFKFAAMMAAAVLSVSSFVSCDDDDEKFESKTFTVELPAQLGTGYEWYGLIVLVLRLIQCRNQ